MSDATHILTLAVGLILGGALAAQAADTNALAEDDIRFAENLARYRYFDLAKDVLTRVEQTDLSSEVEGTALWTRARIVKREAQNTADDALIEDLYTEVIAELEDWARPGSRFAYHEHRTDALWDLGEVFHERAKLRGRLGRQTDAEADFKQADQTYNTLQRECEDRAEQFADLEEDDKADEMEELAALTYFYRGRNNIEWAAHAADREFRLGQAREMLVEYQWNAAADTLPFYFAQYYEAVAYGLEGNNDDAIDLLEELIEASTDTFWQYLDQFSDGPRARIAELFDMAWGEMAKAHLREGDAAQAQAVIEQMRTGHQEKGQPFGRVGYDVLLDWADTLKEQGQTREASDVVKYVADHAIGLPQGERARRDMAEIVSSGDSGSIDLSSGALLAAADGNFQEQAFADAAFNYQRALAAISNQAERDEFELKAWNGAARSLSRLDRHLESALSYERLLELSSARGNTDVAESAANEVYKAYQRRYRQTDQEFDKNLRDAASRRLIDMGIEGDVAFRQAQETFTEASNMARGDNPDPAGVTTAFEAALSDFEGVAEDAPSYERAIVFQARCLAGAGRPDEALARFDMLLARAEDESLTPKDPKARQRREQALAEGLYYKSDLLLRDEVQRPAEVLPLLDEFEARLPGQTGFFELVKLQRVQALAMQGDPETADAALEDLRELNADSSAVPRGAFTTARAYDAAATAAEEGGDPDAAHAATERAAELMWEYAQSTGLTRPEHFNLAALAADWFAEVERYEDAESVYKATVDAFEGRMPDAQLDEAKVGLAKARDSQLAFGRSRDLWVALVGRNPRNQLIMQGAANSFGGWLEVDENGAVREVPGSGYYEEAFALWVQLLKSAGVTGKYQQAWWQSKLGAVYCKYRQGAADQQAYIEARKVISNQQLLTPNYDEDTMEGLEPDAKFEPRYKKLFRYLDGKIPQ